MNPLKPVRFYGSALPRPRFYGDGSKQRTDPPASVNESLLRWAADANWSMGGLSFKKQRMQGKIEGRLRKLKDEPEDDAALTKKVRRKPKSSPGKVTQETGCRKAASKSAQDGEGMVLKRNERPTRGTGRDGRRTSEPQLVDAKRAAAIHPALGAWGEEDGPSPLKSSPRRNTASLDKLDTQTPSAPAVSNVSVSVEFPVRRKRMERALPAGQDSDSDLNWEEFSRTTQPLRRSSRGKSIRRNFNEFLSSDSEEE